MPERGSPVLNMEGLDFVTIDFETANYRRESICQIGITTVKENRIKEVKSWLVNPETFFDDFNVRLHGISENDVRNEPTFDKIWPEVFDYISHGNITNLLFAHNAQFDMQALMQDVERYELQIPYLLFGCTLAISRRAWPGEPSYSLESLCRKFNIIPGTHDAGEDARACAEILLLACKEKEVDMTKPINSTEELIDIQNKFQILFGEISEEGYLSSICQRISKSERIKQIVGDETKNNPDSIFYGKNVVFTGTLSSMKRSEAQQIIADIGGINQTGVNRNTDYLVVGQQDYRIVGDDGMSGKQEKAIELLRKGANIEILSEEDFLHSI